MKHYFKQCMLFAVLLSASSVELYADDVYPWQKWAMAVMERGMEKPVIMEYWTNLEEAGNGVAYLRITDYSYLHRDGDEGRYNPIKLQYGYRTADRQIYIYDFETGKETFAFDFNLSAGDSFTTFNGMEWVVEATKDTLVNVSLFGKGECVSKRLLVVRTPDGKVWDRWLEDFGSFMNHFMIKDMDNVVYSQTLWMMYNEGEYLAREINADPIFGHDSGYLEGAYDWFDNEEEKWEYWEEHGRYEDPVKAPECIYGQGNVVFTDFRLKWDYRAYSCFYRDGDDIYRLYWQEFEPCPDGGTLFMKRDEATFKNVPAPASGKYTVHVGGSSYETGISSIGASSKSADGLYDLQGRRLQTQPEKGIYIKDGRKMCAE